MKTSYYRLLRLGILVMGAAYTAIFAVNIFSVVAEDITFAQWVFVIRGMILMGIGLVVAVKLRRASEHIFFALFLVNFAFNSWIAIEAPSWEVAIFSWSLTAGSFIYAMIVYPGASAAALYSDYFKTKRRPHWYKNAALYFIRPKHFWLIFFPALIAVRILAVFFASAIYGPLNIVVLVCGLIYFRISYGLAGKADRGRLAWVLWGAVVSLGLILVDVLIRIFYPEAPEMVWEVLIVLSTATICLSIIMGVFFAGFLDSGLVVRRTIVYSTIFLSVVFLFSFLEHLIEHGLSVMFHIENDMISAFLAGFLALLIQPLHKILEHKLPKF